MWIGAGLRSLHVMEIEMVEGTEPIQVCGVLTFPMMIYYDGTGCACNVLYAHY